MASKMLSEIKQEAEKYVYSPTFHVHRTLKEDTGYMCVSASLCMEQSGRTQEIARIGMAQGKDLGGWGESRREICLTFLYIVELLAHIHGFLVK